MRDKKGEGNKRMNAVKVGAIRDVLSTSRAIGSECAHLHVHRAVTPI